VWIFCQAPRRKEPQTQCGGFVALLSGPAEIVRLIRHSSRASEGNEVFCCAVCGQLHEVKRIEERLSA
jgi:hypothetical protein